MFLEGPIVTVATNWPNFAFISVHSDCCPVNAPFIRRWQQLLQKAEGRNPFLKKYA
jgi:hypothetical protein